MSSNKYVVSDENGNYVEYTDSLIEAKEVEKEGNEYLAEIGEESRYAIGVKTEEGYTFDRF